MGRRALSSQDNAGLLPFIKALGGGSAGPPGVSGGDILWAPGLPAVGNRVATWAAVQLAIANAHGAITVFVDSTAGAATVTAGTVTDCSRVTFRGMPDTGVVPTMTLPDGAVLTNVYSFEGDFIIDCQSKTLPNFTFANGDQLIVTDGASIVLDATATLAPVGAIASGSIAFLFKDGGTFSNVNAPTVGFANISGSALCRITVLSNPNAVASFPANIVAASAGSTLQWIGDGTARPPVFTGVSAATVQVFNEEQEAWAVLITTTTGASTLPQNSAAMVDTTTGAIGTITLGAGRLGDTFEVSDFGCNANNHNITVAPAAGTQLEDPNNPGAYQAINTTSVFATPGQFCRWRSNGAGKYKIVATGT
jgi:hypothetical protein